MGSIRRRDALVTDATAYARKDDTPDEDALVIPEDLSTLSDEDLAALHDQAMANFDTLYGDGSGLSPADVETLGGLTDAIETLNAETAKREAEASERADTAAQLAARVRPADQNAAAVVTDEESGEEVVSVDDDGYLLDAEGNQVVDSEGNPVLPEDANEREAESAEAEATTPEAVTASASPRKRGDLRVNLSGVRSRARRNNLPRTTPAQGIRDVLKIADVPGSGFVPGQGVDWTGVGKAIDTRLRGFNPGQYENAARQGRHIKDQHSVAVFNREFPAELTLQSNDREHVDEVMRRAMDETRLPQGNLVASGGWCAPSETLYDLCEMESRDGMISVPEINIARGGIQWTTGPDWQAIYNDSGFCYTEAEDIAGDYDGEGGGSKPCYTVPCPDFTEARLDLCGVCISAGLLQSRGYPEVIARTTRGAMVAHDHKMNANVINELVAQSTAVTMPGPQAGATAPLLTSIELQVEHYKYVNRLSRSTTLEAVFPYWVNGVIRSDLSRRLGIDFLNVTDAQIRGWFTARGIAPQFVYDWQDITGTPGSFTAWPETVQFLLYTAGTFVKGTSDIITLDTMYDSVLLGQNNYTALFTEEGWLVAKMCQDSRVVTVPLCADGATHGGIDIACDGTAVAVAA